MVVIDDDAPDAVIMHSLIELSAVIKFICIVINYIHT